MATVIAKLLRYSGKVSSAIFVWPNTDNGERIADLSVSDSFGLTVSSKGTLTVHRVPSFDVVSSKTLPGMFSAVIQNELHITAMQGSKPFVYDANLSIAIASLKRPVIPKVDAVFYSSIAALDDLFLATTTGSAVCLWDIRSATPAMVTTFPTSVGIQTAAISKSIIALGCSNNRLSILDPRNPRCRVANFTIGSDKDGQMHVCLCDEYPSTIGCQFTNGVMGVVDTMSGCKRTQKAPPFETGGGAGKMRPVFVGDQLCGGCPWSCVLQVWDYQNDRVQGITLPTQVSVISACTEIDGIFVGGCNGEVFHVL